MSAEWQCVECGELCEIPDTYDREYEEQLDKMERALIALHEQAHSGPHYTCQQQPCVSIAFIIRGPADWEFAA